MQNVQTFQDNTSYVCDNTNAGETCKQLKRTHNTFVTTQTQNIQTFNDNRTHKTIVTTQLQNQQIF